MGSEQEKRVRERAYALWQESGGGHGESESHWLRAEREHAAGSQAPETDGPADVAVETGKTPRPRAKGRAGAARASSKPKPKTKT